METLREHEGECLFPSAHVAQAYLHYLLYKIYTEGFN